MTWIYIIGVVAYLLVGLLFCGADEAEKEPRSLLLLVLIAWLPLAIIGVITTLFEKPLSVMGRGIKRLTGKQ